MYCMRKVASGWEDDNARELPTDGIRRGRERLAPTIFFHPETKVRVVVYDDDFTFAGTEWQLRKIRSTMCKWYDVNVLETLGSGRRDVQKLKSWAGVRSGRQTSTGAFARLVLERRIEDGQQCSHEIRGTQPDGGRGDLGRRRRSEAVQKFGGHAELHEHGLVRDVTRSERGVHDNGQYEAEQLDDA